VLRIIIDKIQISIVRFHGKTPSYCSKSLFLSSLSKRTIRYYLYDANSDAFHFSPINARCGVRLQCLVLSSFIGSYNVQIVYTIWIL